MAKETALAKESQALTHSMVFYHNDEIIDVSLEIMTAKKKIWNQLNTIQTLEVKLVEKKNIHHLFKQSITKHW